MGTKKEEEEGVRGVGDRKRRGAEEEREGLSEG